MYILGKVLSILSLEAIVASLNRVVGPCVEDLRMLCSREPDAQTKILLILRLKMLATLVKKNIVFFFHYIVILIKLCIAIKCTTLDLRISSGDDSETEDITNRQVTIQQQQQPVLLIAQQLLPFLKGNFILFYFINEYIFLLLQNYFTISIIL